MAAGGSDRLVPAERVAAGRRVRRVGLPGQLERARLVQRCFHSRGVG